MTNQNQTIPKKKKKKLRLGGKALSLDAFVKAKSAPAFNPSEIRKKREFYQNAKKVQKYRKLVKQLGDQNKQPGFDSATPQLKENSEYSKEDNEEHDKLNHVAEVGSEKSGRNLNSTSQAHKRRKQQKGSNYLEKLRVEYEKKKQEEEKIRKEREEIIAAKQEARLKALQVRKDTRAKMWKKTRSGQPVMKHRLEHLLDSLQREQ